MLHERAVQPVSLACLPLPRRMHPRLRALLVLLAAIVPDFSQAQSRPGQIDDAAYVGYGRRDGLPDAPVLSLRLERSGHLVAGSSQGVYRFNGRSWEANRCR